MLTTKSKRCPWFAPSLPGSLSISSQAPSGTDTCHDIHLLWAHESHWWCQLSYQTEVGRRQHTFSETIKVFIESGFHLCKLCVEVLRALILCLTARGQCWAWPAFGLMLTGATRASGISLPPAGFQRVPQEGLQVPPVHRNTSAPVRELPSSTLGF